MSETFEHSPTQTHQHEPLNLPQYTTTIGGQLGPQPHTTVTCTCGAKGTTTFVPGHLLVVWEHR